jgi:hypothetical protein
MKVLQQISKNADTYICGKKTIHVGANDPGACPIFVFMPSKVQIVQMIIKAVFDEAMPL